MVLESTYICIDNSDPQINGDYEPTRMQAQKDAANLVIQCKLRSNAENQVGIISMAAEVNALVSLTTDSNKLYMKLLQLQPKRNSKFVEALRTAQMALNLRTYRNQKPRIVCFVGSPISDEQAQRLIPLAKKFRKEKVAVDVVCFGDTSEEGNVDKLTEFIKAINGKDGNTSNLVSVPPGSKLSEAVLQSNICRGEDGSAPLVAPGVGGGFDFGVDPSEDPELAMALRVSLEEQRQRQEQEAREAAEQSGQEAAAAEAPEQPNFDAMTEDEQLAYALRMSMEQPADGGEPMDTREEGEGTSADAKTADNDDSLDELISDPQALQELVQSLPGVDPNSDIIRETVQEVSKEQKKKSEKEKEKGGKEEEGDKKGAGSSSSSS